MIENSRLFTFKGQVVTSTSAILFSRHLFTKFLNFHWLAVFSLQNQQERFELPKVKKRYAKAVYYCIIILLRMPIGIKISLRANFSSSGKQALALTDLYRVYFPTEKKLFEAVVYKEMVVKQTTPIFRIRKNVLKIRTSRNWGIQEAIKLTCHNYYFGLFRLFQYLHYLISEKFVGVLFRQLKYFVG